MKVEQLNSPLIVAFVRDLIFQVRIEEAAHLAGFSVRFLDLVDLFGQEDDKDPDRPHAEPLFGRDGVLIDQISQANPYLLIFDLSNKSIPWKEWISILSSVPATRRIPIIAYGSHIDSDAIEAARRAGAKAVFARSRFASDLADLISRYARIVGHGNISEWCDGQLPEIAIKGLEEFNRGEYFEAHESLEAAWMAEEHPGRELYRAILQVAVAYYQIVRHNFKGAAKMFLRIRQWIKPLPDDCRGIDLKTLKMDIDSVHKELWKLGPERIHEFDLDLLKPIRYRILHHDME